MLIKVIKVSAFICTGYCVGAISSILFDYYHMIKTSFWEFTFIDLVSLIIYSIIAIYVAHYLKNRFSDRQMKKSFFLNIVDDIGKIFEDRTGFFRSFMIENPDEEAKRAEVMMLLKKISNKIRVLEMNKQTFNENVACLVDRIRADYSEIKNILTGDDYFTTKSFTTENINKMTKHSNDIIFSLDQLKVSIFD